MILKVVIFALSFLTTSAYPHHRNTREDTWTDLKANQAHDMTDVKKDVDKTYKSHIESSGLYNQDDHSRNPMAEEMLRKLHMESERLRVRLRQELAELRERLSPSPAHLSHTLDSVRERLAPLTQQLQSSLSSNTQDMCAELSLYLQGLETAEAPTKEVFHWMSQTLDHSSSKVAHIISDFHTKTVEMTAHLKETSSEEETAKSELWHDISSRLGHEVSSLSVEAQRRFGVLKAEMATLLQTGRPLQAEVTASFERFCQNAGLQGQVFQARMEKLFQGLEEEVWGTASRSPTSFSVLSIQPGESLPEEFSIKLSALIQDILHSV